MRRASVPLLFVLIVMAGCAHTGVVDLTLDLASQEPGSLAKVERLGGQSAMKLRAIFYLGDMPAHVPIRNSVRTYRVEYWTTRHDGEPTLASGLIAVPKRGEWKGVVSYQHGTTANRKESPSSLGLEGMLVAGAFAGDGYLCVATDYVGLGTNRELHPYLHAEGTANAAIDLLKASQEFCAQMEREWPSRLFLVGASQGGHATAAVQRALEADEASPFEITAAASASGAFDLAGIAFPYALEGASGAHVFYLAYMVNAYSAIYGHPLESVVNDEYAKTLPGLFDGDQDDDTIEAGLPETPRELFRKEFLDDFDAGKPTWLLDALAENGTYDWAPKAPLRLYFGDEDKDVNPRESEQAYRTMRRNGGNVAMVFVGHHDHLESILRAVPLIQDWFDELSAAEQSVPPAQ